MIESDDIFVWIKNTAIVLVIFAFFWLGIPWLRDVNAEFDRKIQEFMRLFFQGSVTVIQTPEKIRERYGADTLEDNKDLYTLKFSSGVSDADLEAVLILGEYLLPLYPSHHEIRRKYAFACYLSGNHEAAQEHYRIILKRLGKRRLSFNALKRSQWYRCVKRVLIEMSALSYEQGNTDEMLAFYRDYLRVSYPPQVFNEMSTNGIDEAAARQGIIDGFAGEGLFALRKAIDLLEAMRREFPDDAQLMMALGMRHYELLTTCTPEQMGFVQGHVYAARLYLNQAYEHSKKRQRELIEQMLAKLAEIEDKYYNQSSGRSE